MRIILSHGQVNIFNLAWNAWTSVNRIERCYAGHLPLSREMIKNLKSFGEGWQNTDQFATRVSDLATELGACIIADHRDTARRLAQ